MLIFKCFPIQVGNFISYGVCKLAYKPPLKRVTPHGVGRCPQGRGDRSVRGGSPLGGGRIRPRSATSSAVISKPSGGIRSLPSLSAWGLPTPVVALACIGNVDIQVFFRYRWVTLLDTAFASSYIASPERGDSPRGGEMPAGQRGPLSTRGTATGGGGVPT